MDWRLRVAKQAVVGRIPFGEGLRRLKRRLFGYAPDPGNMRSTLANFEQMKAAFEAQGRTFNDATVLEIGTGWFPTIPILLSLCGAKRVLMSDLVPHMDEVTFASTLRFLRQARPDNARLAALSRLEELPLTYLAPFDVSAIPDQSVDAVVSRTVLEHIPEHVLIDLMKALRPKLRKDGLMVHLIDHSDHLEHVDRSISKINFLTWSEKKHAMVNHLTREGENRLRHHEYQRVFDTAGYRVVAADAEVHQPTLELAKDLPLVGPYRDMTAEQLAILSSLYVVAPR